MTPWCILHDPTYKASSSDSPPKAEAWCGKHLIESPSCSESGALLSLAGCGISGDFPTPMCRWVDVVDVYISYWKLGWFFQLYIHVGFFGGKYISIYHFRHLHKTDRSSWKKTGMPFLQKKPHTFTHHVRSVHCESQKPAALSWSNSYGSYITYCWWKYIPNNHLACKKPCKYWDKLSTNWCRISSINSIHHQ